MRNVLVMVAVVFLLTASVSFASDTPPAWAYGVPPGNPPPNTPAPDDGSVKHLPGSSALVITGSGKTTQCATCHGTDLKGLGPLPGLAGRSPSYLVRQLYDMQHGARKGPGRT